MLLFQVDNNEILETNESCTLKNINGYQAKAIKICPQRERFYFSTVSDIYILNVNATLICIGYKLMKAK